MPAETETLEQQPESGFPDVAANNDEVKRKLEDQGADRHSTPDDLKPASDALDEIAKSIAAEKEKKKTAPEVTPEVEPAKKADSAPEVDPEAEAAAAKEAAEREAAAKRAEEFFKGSPTLPPGASPKSSEAFSAIKVKAAQEIAARERERDEALARAAELEAKLANGPDPEVLKELEDHRTWRAKLDVEFDPKFKEFDKQVKANHDFIYAQLSRSPAITKETIEQIKKYGGPENVNLEKIFAAINDPTTQRLVEAKVADIEMAKFNKEQAIKAAKENVAQYQEAQQKAYQENAGAHNRATEQHFSQLTTKLPWFAEKPVDPKADEPTRKAAEAHNAFLKDTKVQLQAALKDDSAEMRAIMLTGMAQLLHVQHVRAAEKAELEGLKKQLAEANTKLEKFTKASVSRLRETGAPASGASIPKPKADFDFTTPAADALDNIAKQIMQERAAKQNA